MEILERYPLVSVKNILNADSYINFKFLRDSQRVRELKISLSAHHIDLNTRAVGQILHIIVSVVRNFSNIVYNQKEK